MILIRLLKTNKYSFKDDCLISLRKDLIPWTVRQCKLLRSYSNERRIRLKKFDGFDEIEKKELKENQKVDTNTSGISNVPHLKSKKKVVNVSIANVLHGAKNYRTYKDIDELLSNRNP